MFGGNPYLGAVMGMIMVSGDLLNAYAYGSAITENTVPVWEIGALTIEKVGYQGTVLPVLAAAAILAFLEKKLHKTIPEYLDNLLTPALSILITAFLTFTVVGGVMRTAGDWITMVFFGCMIVWGQLVDLFWIYLCTDDNDRNASQSAAG